MKQKTKRLNISKGAPKFKVEPTEYPTIRRLYEEGWTQKAISRKYNVSHERIRQILQEQFGLTGNTKRRNRREEIRDIIETEPEISISELARKTGVGIGMVGELVHEALPHRAYRAIGALAQQKKLAKGRVILTETLISRMYYQERKNQKQIGKELGYQQTAISRFMASRNMEIDKTISRRGHGKKATAKVVK